MSETAASDPDQCRRDPETGRWHHAAPYARREGVLRVTGCDACGLRLAD